MSTSTNFIKVDVPAGFPPQSTPVKDNERIPDQDIRIEPITKDDLHDVARGLHASFPEVWWQKSEPLDMRPAEDVRVNRLAKRLEAFVLNPDLATMVKAVHVPTNEFAGCAGWHLPIPASKRLSLWSAPIMAYRGTRWQPGWTDEDVQEMWKDVLVAKCEEEFGTYDQVREEEFGDQPYWYLAPFYTLEKFRGRGVGGLLLKWAIEKADSETVPMVLEALPNARPVYAHYGFEPPASLGKKPNREPLMIRPARTMS